MGGGGGDFKKLKYNRDICFKCQKLLGSSDAETPPLSYVPLEPAARCWKNVQFSLCRVGREDAPDSEAAAQHAVSSRVTVETRDHAVSAYILMAFTAVEIPILYQAFQ